LLNFGHGECYDARSERSEHGLSEYGEDVAAETVRIDVEGSAENDWRQNEDHKQIVVEVSQNLDHMSEWVEKDDPDQDWHDDCDWGLRQKLFEGGFPYQTAYEEMQHESH